MSPDTSSRRPAINIDGVIEQPGSRHVAANSHDVIEVRGARENNLDDISLDIPKRRLTVFTGVSGSGKSSLVFGTIAAESQRLINETYTAFIQSFMPSLGRPDVDALRNLGAAIVVDQERMGANSRSTVGTATDAHTMLRIVFSRLGNPMSAPRPPSASTAPRACAPNAKDSAGCPTSTSTNSSMSNCRSTTERSPSPSSTWARGTGRPWPSRACSTPTAS